MENFLFRKVELWLVLFLAILLIVSALLFGWAVQYRAAGGDLGGRIIDVMSDVAAAPTPLIRMLHDTVTTLQPQRQSFRGKKEYHRHDKNFSDDGYILISSWNDNASQVGIYLFDLKLQKRIYEWLPPIDDILDRTSYRGSYNDTRDYRALHPYLMSDGSLLFSSQEGPLARIDACSKLKWTIDRHFHHTIERGPDGNFYVPVVLAKPDQFMNNRYGEVRSVTKRKNTLAPIRDDGFAIISPDGVILREWSVADILENAGYWTLLYGIGEYEIDRIHLNDAAPILSTDAFAQKGDVLLSARNISTVFLFRPSSEEIVWLKTGPWLNQHDPDYLGGGIFSIFGNDFSREVGFPFDGSAIYRFQPDTGQVERWLDLGKYDISNNAQGIHQTLKNGDIFVEAGSMKLHRISQNGMRWTYWNKLDESFAGVLNWSRYFSRDELNLNWIAQGEC